MDKNMNRRLPYDLGYSLFDKKIIYKTDSEVNFFQKEEKDERERRTNIDDFYKEPTIYKVTAIQFRLVGMDGSELLKYEDCFGLVFSIDDEECLNIEISDMEFIGKRVFERKLSIPVILTYDKSVDVKLLVDKKLARSVIGQVSLVGYIRKNWS